MKFFWSMTTGTILIAVLIYFKMSVVFAFNQTQTEYMEEVRWNMDLWLDMIVINRVCS